jgi:hypothetical protein
MNRGEMSSITGKSSGKWPGTMSVFGMNRTKNAESPGARKMSGDAKKGRKKREPEVVFRF